MEVSVIEGVCFRRFHFTRFLFCMYACNLNDLFQYFMNITLQMKYVELGSGFSSGWSLVLVVGGADIPSGSSQSSVHKC